MKICVIGGGNGGLAIAWDCAIHGHDVSLWNVGEHASTVHDAARAGGITATGDVEGHATLAYAGDDLGRAMAGAELVYVAGPAFATAPLAEAVRRHVRPGQAFIVCPGSCGGAVVFKNALGLDLADETVVVAETSTLPYAVRIVEEAHIHVHHKLRAGIYLATVPGRLVDDLLPRVTDVYPGMEAAPNVWKTTLQNANPIIHPAVSLCNAGAIDRGGDFLFYEEGVTPHVAHLLEAVDDERIALAEALGVDVLRDPALGLLQGYHVVDTYVEAYPTAPGFQGIKAQGQLDHRYLNEDVGYGLVFFEDLGRRLGVPTPVVSAMITVTSAVMQRDYRHEGARTLTSLGLGDVPGDQLAGVLS